MSIINKMLKDLDARQSRAADTENYLNQMRPVSLPVRREISRVWVVIGTVLAAVAGAAAWTGLRPLLTGHAPAPVVQTRATTPAAKPATVAAVSVSPAPPSIAVPTAVPASQPASGPTMAAQTIPVVPESESGSSPKRENPAGPIAASVLTAQPRIMNPNSAASGVRDQKAVARHDAPPTDKSASVTLKEASVEALPESAAVPVLSRTDAAARKRAVVMPDTPVSMGVDTMDAPAQAKVFTPQQRIENAYQQAIGWIQQGRKVEAMTALEQVLQAEPGHAAARQVLIGLLIDSQRHDDARKLAREGLTKDPSQSGLAMILARLQLESNELRSAIETLQRSQSYALTRGDYQAFLAALLQRDNRHKEAIENYLLALQKTPQNGVWWMGMAISLQAENRRNEARDAYARAKNSSSLSDELQAFVDGRLQQLK